MPILNTLFSWWMKKRIHQIELFLLHSILGSRIPYRDVFAIRQLFPDRDVASDEPNVGKILRSFIEPLEVLAEGSNIVVKNDREDHY